MSDIDWLIETQFRHVGHWSNPHTKLQRLVRLERTPGIYAFVVEGQVRYIGKATSLQHRIRAYNRALIPETSRKFRKVHHAIQRVWTDSTTIDVWVYHFDEIKDEPLIRLEAKWINEKKPEWNG